MGPWQVGPAGWSDWVFGGDLSTAGNFDVIHDVSGAGPNTLTLIAAAPDLAHTAAVLGEQRKAVLALIVEKMMPGEGGPVDCDSLWPSAVAKAAGITEAEITAALEDE